MPNVQGKNILITGGKSGLGLATAQALAEAGASITIADISPADNVVADLNKRGYRAQYIQCDTSDWEAQHAAFKKAVEFSDSGALHAVALFAAVDKTPHLVDIVKQPLFAGQDISKPDLASIDVNLRGVFYSSTLALYYMNREPSNARSKEDDRSLTIVSSLAAYVDDTHNTAYTASKFGVRGLFRAIRARAKDELGVRCNLIAPWAVKTPMTAPILKLLEQAGIQEGKGITFASPQVVVDAAVKCIADTAVSGKCFVFQFSETVCITDTIQVEPLLQCLRATSI